MRKRVFRAVACLLPALAACQLLPDGFREAQEPVCLDAMILPGQVWGVVVLCNVPLSAFSQLPPAGLRLWRSGTNAPLAWVTTDSEALSLWVSVGFASGEQVEVDYDGAGGLLGANGRPLAAFGRLTVFNGLFGTNQAPAMTVGSRYVNVSDAREIWLDTGYPLAPVWYAGPAGFTVRCDGLSWPIESVRTNRWLDSSLVLTGFQAVRTNQVVEVDYGGAPPYGSLDGRWLSPFTGLAVMNNSTNM